MLKQLLKSAFLVSVWALSESRQQSVPKRSGVAPSSRGRERLAMGKGLAMVQDTRCSTEVQLGKCRDQLEK